MIDLASLFYVDKFLFIQLWVLHYGCCLDGYSLDGWSLNDCYLDGCVLRWLLIKWVLLRRLLFRWLRLRWLLLRCFLIRRLLFKWLLLRWLLYKMVACWWSICWPISFFLNLDITFERKLWPQYTTAFFSHTFYMVQQIGAIHLTKI